MQAKQMDASHSGLNILPLAGRRAGQRALHEADGGKRKINVENCDLLHQFEEAERTAVSLSKDRSSLTTQLEDAKRLADAETRERINLLGKMR